MQYLSKLNLLNFKNHENLELEFCPKINALVGKNGVGKTNVLDAVYYLSMCKSYINGVDKHNIRFDSGFFSIQGKFKHEKDSSTVLCSVKAGAKKVFKRNKVEYEKLADHIGLYPVVFISPYDGDLIAEGSEMRRKWMDGIISQIDKKYLENLMNYNRVVEQRNALLKQIHLGNQNTSELEIWDAPMEQLGEKIYERRLVFVDSFIPIFEKYYQTIGAETETVQMVYRSDFGKGAFTSLLQSNLRKDLAYQYSTVGIHKDDLLFSLNGNPVKKYGSQGQQKSYVIALRLAQYEYIAEICNQKPVLLLDDIFDKLDSTRILKLIDLVSSDFFGQVIITDTESERLELIFKERNAEFRIFDIHSHPIPHE